MPLTRLVVQAGPRDGVQRHQNRVRQRREVGEAAEDRLQPEVLRHEPDVRATAEGRRAAHRAVQRSAVPPLGSPGRPRSFLLTFSSF